MEHSTTALRRRIPFTRTKSKGGIFRWPAVTFMLKHEDGSTLGQLIVHGQKAHYTSEQERHDEFKVKKNFWGTRWVLEDNTTSELGRFKYGWSFTPSITLADGEVYTMKAKAPWPVRRKKLGNPTTSVTFLRGDVPVLIMESIADRPFFSNEATAPLEGTIATNIDSNRTIAALLLFYQTFIEARNKSAA